MATNEDLNRIHSNFETLFSNEQVRANLSYALTLAERALELGNYPIGSIIVDASNSRLAEGMNESTTSHVAAHAEIKCIEKMGSRINKYTSGDHFLFSSLEPCFGCSFFIARTNIRTIHSALKDPHKGGMSDLKNQDQYVEFFKNIALINEPFEDLREQSRDLMRRYFVSISNFDAAKYYGYQPET
jgi:tRNA(Arg) A34 adenosine deaminase TadA